MPTSRDFQLHLGRNPRLAWSANITDTTGLSDPTSISYVSGGGTGGTQPTGPGITRWQDLTPAGSGPGDTFTAAPSTKVSFPPGTTTAFGPGFGRPSTYPVYGAFPSNVTAILGSGINSTTLIMAANTMTAADIARIPAQSTGSTNPLHLIRVDKAALSDLTILATNQSGHMFNAINMYKQVNITHQNVRVKGIPGNNGANPGETFSFNDYQGTNNALVNCEIDGTDSTGTKVAASGIGLNSTNGFTTTDCYSHDMLYGAGVTHYEVTGTVTHTRLRTYNNHLGVNFERNNGLIANLVACDWTGSLAIGYHMVLDSDLGSVKCTITDPIALIGGKFIVRTHTTYNGVANKQLHSDVKLIVGGVDRSADLLAFVS